MPLGFERLNERTTRPNTLINFIKPLEGADKVLAQDFLERIAAICYPIMKANHIAVMSLEEFPPNLEFVGRNFNAGEVIQLVLKAPYTGQWLPFKHVQMVMMHELAHCKQMNHSKQFWKVRDSYAEDLRGLWERNYTGEGIWGRGQTLLSGSYTTNTMPEAMEGVRSLCGGTYRTQKGKRKRKPEKPQVSYAERQQRRILKKFGAGGQALGNDEETRARLEAGKKVKGKPRVAESARGRELRAAAALARFDQTKDKVVKKEEIDSGSETDSEYDDLESTQETALDMDGKELLDSHGHGMVKVCEAEDREDDDVRREMDELSRVDTSVSTRRRTSVASHKGRDDISAETENREDTKHAIGSSAGQRLQPTQTSMSISHSQCSVCSFANAEDTLTCAVCANVLDPAKLPNHWRCQSLTCCGGPYVNSDDCGVCGACGAAKPSEIPTVIRLRKM